MIELLKTLDVELFSFINHLRTETLDKVFLVLTSTIFWVPLFALIIYLIIKQYKKQAIGILSFLILFVFLNDQSCNIIKKTVKRIRPSHDVEMISKVHLARKSDGTYYRGGKYSFPSAHAANSILLMLFFIFFVKPRRKWAIILMILWSLLMAYSRIYLGVHYPSDIWIGFLLGSFWGVGMYYGYSYCFCRRIP